MKAESADRDALLKDKKELQAFSPRVRISYTPGPDLFIEDWLSRQNHMENKDAEIPSKELNINVIQTTTNIPDCMTTQEL